MQAREFATKFLEDLIAFFGVNVLVEVEEDEEDNVLTLNVPSTRLNGFFIGQRGENLRSLQHLVNMALRRNDYEDVAVTVDVAGYKKQRNERLARKVQQLAEDVIKTGEPHAMRPMSSYERRVVHKALVGISGVESESEGEGRDRHIVIKSAAADKTDEEE